MRGDYWSRVSQRQPAAHLALQPKSAHLRPAPLPTCPCHSKVAPWARSTGITPEFVRNAGSHPGPGTLTWICRPQGTPAASQPIPVPSWPFLPQALSPLLAFQSLSPRSPPTSLLCLLSLLPPQGAGLSPPPLSLHSLFPGHFISLHGFSPLMTNTHVHRPINISPRHPTPEPHEVQDCTGIVREVKLLTEALLRASSGLHRRVSWHAHPKPTRWVRCSPSDQWRGHASGSRWTSGSQLMQAELGGSDLGF